MAQLFQPGSQDSASRQAKNPRQRRKPKRVYRLRLIGDIYLLDGSQGVRRLGCWIIEMDLRWVMHLVGMAGIAGGKADRKGVIPPGMAFGWVRERRQMAI